MQIARSSLANLCAQFGKMLKVPDSVNAQQLLWALAGNESSFGANSNPRHEQGYCYGHQHFNEQRSKLWGCLAHCSFGPWQVMYANFNVSISPLDLLAPSGVALIAGAAVQLINHIIGVQGAKNLEEIGEAYNSGKIQPDPEYVAKLKTSYMVPFGSLT